MVVSVAEYSLHFNYDDFDKLVAEALEDNERTMKEILTPGKIGSVIVRQTHGQQPEVF